ncbi:thioredoxin-like 1-like protein, partial [Mytilus galloprovincialis]
LIVVDFFATWCGPCVQIAPVYQKLSDEYSDCIFLKVDVDEVEDVAAESGISAMPTFQCYKNGNKERLLSPLAEGQGPQWPTGLSITSLSTLRWWVRILQVEGALESRLT